VTDLQEKSIKLWRDSHFELHWKLCAAEAHIEKLEAALEDALQYVSRADWHYLKDETRKALEGKDD